MRQGKKRVKSRYSRSCLYACCGIFLKNPLPGQCSTPLSDSLKTCLVGQSDEEDVCR